MPDLKGIDDEISLTLPAGDGDIQQAVSAAFGPNARLDRYELSVYSPFPGAIVPSGAVSPWAEHDDAVAAAWSATGITLVDDRIVALTSVLAD